MFVFRGRWRTLSYGKRRRLFGKRGARWLLKRYGPGWFIRRYGRRGLNFLRRFGGRYVIKRGRNWYFKYKGRLHRVIWRGKGYVAFGKWRWRNQKWRLLKRRGLWFYRHWGPGRFFRYFRGWGFKYLRRWGNRFIYRRGRYWIAKWRGKRYHIRGIRRLNKKVAKK